MKAGTEQGCPKDGTMVGSESRLTGIMKVLFSVHCEAGRKKTSTCDSHKGSFSDAAVARWTLGLPQWSSDVHNWK